MHLLLFLLLQVFPDKSVDKTNSYFERELFRSLKYKENIDLLISDQIDLISSFIGKIALHLVLHVFIRFRNHFY